MRIGIDLGGTKIEAIVLDDDGAERFRKRVPTPKDDYHGTLVAIADLVRDAEAAVEKECTVGVGHPGAMSPATGFLKNANSVWLNDKPLDLDLAIVIGRPVRTANDANCFALSEAVDGAAKGARVVFGVIVGTGTGGGVVVDGGVLTGPNAVAGEWGHSPLPWPTDEERPGPECYCGQRGCIETFLSGPGLRRDAQAVLGEEISSEEVMRRHESGDEAVRPLLDRYAGRMARSLATVINLLDPDAIVLGGGMSNLPFVYEEVPERWGAYVFSDRVDTPLLPPVHGDSSGVRGAAWLWD